MSPRAGAATASALLRLRVAAGLDADDDRDLSPRLRRLVAVARQVGAPLGEAIDAGLAAEEDQRRAERAIVVAGSQTRLVAGGLLVAPLLLVPGLGRLLGADLLGFYRSGIGLLVLAAGLALLTVGALIIVALLRRVRRAPAHPTGSGAASWLAAAAGLVAWWFGGPALALPSAAVGWIAVASRRRVAPDPPGVEEAVELIAAAQGGGISSSEALRLAAGQLPALATPLNRLAFDLEVGEGVADTARGDPLAIGDGAGSSALERLAAVLTVAHDLGAPVAPTLRQLAAELRADELARVLAAAERLPAQLTFPTALCLLPGTVLLVGAPIVQAGLSAVGT